jgi:hypothetical protein
MPESMGRVEFVPIPLATTDSALRSEDWLTVNLMAVLSYLLVLSLYIKAIVVIRPV